MTQEETRRRTRVRRKRIWSQLVVNQTYQTCSGIRFHLDRSLNLYLYANKPIQYYWALVLYNAYCEITLLGESSLVSEGQDVVFHIISIVSFLPIVQREEKEPINYERMTCSYTRTSQMVVVILLTQGTAAYSRAT